MGVRYAPSSHECRCSLRTYLRPRRLEGLVVYLRRLVCRNIKGFREIDIDLCPLYADARSDRQARAEGIAALDSLLSEAPSRIGAEDLGPFPGWSVITGENGSGKSTILKSIALALIGPDEASLQDPGYDGWVSVGSK